MSEAICDDKFVELTYKVTDTQSGQVLSTVEFPIAYVHGRNQLLLDAVQEQLEGKRAGETIDVPVDCNKLYGPRDEALVFTDRIENVPSEYRELGTTITMENEKGEVRKFIVTRMDDETLTVDGNNPLCGRDVVFTLEVLTVRDATDEEIEEGGAVGANAEVDDALKIPIN